MVCASQLVQDITNDVGTIVMDYGARRASGRPPGP